MSPDLLQLAQETPAEELPALIGTFAQAHAVALARLTAGRALAPARNLSAEEAAERLGVSISYLHKNAKALPFAVRIGRRLLFDSAGLERWAKRQRTTN